MFAAGSVAVTAEGIGSGDMWLSCEVMDYVM
jgi:hypothetical protein